MGGLIAIIKNISSIKSTIKSWFDKHSKTRILKEKLEQLDTNHKNQLDELNNQFIDKIKGIENRLTNQDKILIKQNLQYTQFESKVDSLKEKQDMTFELLKSIVGSEKK